jgi:hypothetical protein
MVINQQQDVCTLYNLVFHLKVAMNWMLNMVALPGIIGRGIQGASSETGLLAGFFY